MRRSRSSMSSFVRAARSLAVERARYNGTDSLPDQAVADSEVLAGQIGPSRAVMNSIMREAMEYADGMSGVEGVSDVEPLRVPSVLSLIEIEQ